MSNAALHGSALFGYALFERSVSNRLIARMLRMDNAINTPPKSQENSQKKVAECRVYRVANRWMSSSPVSPQYSNSLATHRAAIRNSKNPPTNAITPTAVQKIDKNW